MSDGDSEEGETAPPVDALAEYATSLGTTDPRVQFDRSERLDAVFGDARIVGLGEPTHGMRDIFRLKHRLLRYLVREHDLRVLAFEADLPEMLAVDEYVVHGRGDPKDALDGIHSWTWNVESVLEAVEWLRAFNEGRPLGDRVRCYGIDAQHTTGAVEQVREYLDTVDATLSGSLSADLRALDDGGVTPVRTERTGVRIVASDQVAATVRRHLDEHREVYVERTGERSWQLARQHASVIEQATAYRRARTARSDAAKEDDGEVAPAVRERPLRRRDRAMADNVDWLLEFADTDRIAVWGHDAHLNRSKHAVRDRAIATTPMGGYLADRHGDDYVAVGFSVGRGSFQALGPTRGDPRHPYELQEYTLDGPQGTVDAVLDGLGEAPVLLDIRAASDDDRTGDWLATPHGTFSAGATYDPDTPETYVTEYVLDEAFDAICYLDGTTRARPIGTDK